MDPNQRSDGKVDLALRSDPSVKNVYLHFALLTVRRTRGAKLWPPAMAFPSIQCIRMSWSYDIHFESGKLPQVTYSIATCMLNLPVGTRPGDETFCGRAHVEKKAMSRCRRI